MTDTIRVRIFRFDPSRDKQPRYEEYEIPREKEMRVLAVLERLREVAGVEFAFRYSCTIARCGTCGVKVNGKHRLACWEPAENEMTIEPLDNFPVVRDLVIDRSRYYEHLKDVEPVVRRDEPTQFPEKISDPSFLNESGKLYSCIECMICMSACPVFKADKRFHGPATLWQAFKLEVDPRDSKKSERLAKVATSVMWRCDHCYECTRVCPAEVDPGSAIVSLKKMVLADKAGASNS